MAKYKFQIRKHLRDDMYKTETIELELTDSEYNTISTDDNKYSKGSALVSSKIGEKVESLGFPIKINEEKNNSSKKDKNNDVKKSSLWKPIWAMPFKLIWRIIKSIF